MSGTKPSPNGRFIIGFPTLRYLHNIPEYTSTVLGINGITQPDSKEISPNFSREVCSSSIGGRAYFLEVVSGARSS
jgi:hypothetical protein